MSNTITPVEVAPGTIQRQDFSGQAIEVSGETAMAAQAARAKALVEARFLVALRRPRDLDEVRVRVMREVERPGFAEIAWYRKPIGKGVEGLSVRFFEAAARCMGNIMIEPVTTYDDERVRDIRLEVTDLETNYTVGADVTIEKTVERRSLDDGRVALEVRKNSRGELTYTVPATEDEMLQKQNALLAKARRNLLQQIVPGDITDQAKARILAIRRGDAAKDPDGMRRKVIDAFASLNVMPPDLKRYLGHDIATASPAELTDLRDLYSAIQAGEATWAEVLAEKTGAEGAPTEKPKGGLDGAADRAAADKPPAPATPKCEHPNDKLKNDASGNIACTACGEVVAKDETPPAGAGEDSAFLRGEAPRTGRSKLRD